MYSGNELNYIIIFKTFQSFANNKIQLSLVRIDVKSASKNNNSGGSSSGGSGSRSSNGDGFGSGSDNKKYKKCGKKYYLDCK